MRSKLQEVVDRLQQESIAPSTLKVYKSQWKKFKEFCRDLEPPVFIDKIDEQLINVSI